MTETIATELDIHVFVSLETQMYPFNRVETILTDRELTIDELFDSMDREYEFIKNILGFTPYLVTIGSKGQVKEYMEDN